jgi:hypothetical protein
VEEADLQKRLAEGQKVTTYDRPQSEAQEAVETHQYEKDANLKEENKN